ncbi:MAG: AmmeMemoRadiSam system protein B [Spirochaetales bacterium]|nr:AmmeMemoRadiSam system protein B [Spirochaetales bacterium]
MNVRQRTLPAGWYPATAEKTKAVIDEYIHARPHPEIKALAGITPHAGWDFSGSIACEVIRCLDPDADTIVIVGGHLPPGKNILAASEQGFETPFGILEADIELLLEIKRRIFVKEDAVPDNTVEVQLPFIKYLLPQSRAVWMRAAPSHIAEELGEVIDKAAQIIGRRVVVIGSTDLTHYGFNYGFLPKGSGKEAFEWVTEVNDKKILDAFIAMDAKAAIGAAREDRSACSVGGAVAAVSFAREKGCKKGRLLRYMTSRDIYPSDSFVGYGGIVFE